MTPPIPSSHVLAKYLWPPPAFYCPLGGGCWQPNRFYLLFLIILSPPPSPFHIFFTFWLVFFQDKVYALCESTTVEEKMSYFLLLFFIVIFFFIPSQHFLSHQTMHHFPSLVHLRFSWG